MSVFTTQENEISQNTIKLNHNIEAGDFWQGYGSIVKVTEKAICVEINNGKWLGNKYFNRWVPKSAIVFYKAINGVGILNDDSKHLIVADLKPWFKL